VSLFIIKQSLWDLKQFFYPFCSSYLRIIKQSLWDLKPTTSNTKKEYPSNNKAVPMGFETYLFSLQFVEPEYNKAVPMGFETLKIFLSIERNSKIIKQSLWDLKPYPNVFILI